MDISVPSTCPYANFQIHSSMGGCCIYTSTDSDDVLHMYNGTSISQCINGEPLVKAIFPFLPISKNLHIKFNTNGGTGQISTAVNINKFKHICVAITSPHMFWVILNSFVELVQEPCLYAHRNEIQPLYFSLKSMADALIDVDYQLKFLRPTHFIHDERKFYLGFFELINNLYQSLLSNTDSLNQSAIAKGLRNITKCKLSYHIEPKMLRNQFRCGPGCDQKCVKPPSWVGRDFRGDDTLTNWCYGQLKSDVQHVRYCRDGKVQFDGNAPLTEEDLNKIYQFECIFSRSFARLHYEMFGRNLKMHTIFCCPKILLGPMWFQELRRFTEKQYETL